MRNSEHHDAGPNPMPRSTEGLVIGKPIERTRSETLKSEALPKEQTQGDLADRNPDNSSIVQRGRDGRNPAIPTVGQFTLEGDIVTQRQTRRGMKEPRAGDQLAIEASLGYQDPHTQEKARRQNWAITRSALKKAKDRSGGTK